MKTVKEIEMELSEAKEAEKREDCVSRKSHPYELGKNYLIRTVTHIQIGRLFFVGEKELVLSGACWVADTGRFQDCLMKGVENDDHSEIELFKNDVVVGRGAIVDATVYDHDLPDKQK